MGKEAFEKKKMQNNPLYIMERQQNATQLVNLLLIYITPFSFFLFFYKNVAFPAQAEYSYFSADLRLKILFYYS